jgi:hypothetical protein
MRTAATSNPQPALAFVAFGCLLAGGFLAWHYPLAPAIMLAAFTAFCAATFLRPEIWLFALPAILPVIGFASWTGWIACEEFDIFVLAAAAGGYAALAFGRRNMGKAVADSRTSASVSSNRAVASRHTSSHRPNSTEEHLAGTGSRRRPANAAIAEQFRRSLATTGGSEGIGSGAAALREDQNVRLSGFARGLIALFALSILVALYRGIASAATAGFGWFDGYDDAINSVRIAKTFFLVLLLFPLLKAEQRRSGPHALELLAAGMAAGLGLAAIAIVWERMAFPGLLNFSTDYRATALFWEMHVGGAALDGFLALTAPFAVWQFLRPSTPRRLALAGGLVLVAGYACLATFSRGVYLALPISMGLLTLLLLLQRRSLSIASAAAALATGCISILAIAVAAWLVFRAGGYRSLLAVLGVVVLMLPLGSGTRRVSAGAWLVALALGGAAGAIGGLVAGWIPKGSYAIFAVAFTCCAGLVWQRRQAGDAGSAVVAIAAYVWAMVAAAVVAAGWGGAGALHDASLVLLLLLALTIWNSIAPKALWPGGTRAQGGIVAGAALVAITVAVFTGGAYMGERFVTSERDLGGRLQHWGNGIGMFNTPADWLFGKGLGRFPQSFYFNARERDFPGSYRIEARDAKRFLLLFGPGRDAGFGELLRVSQRVPVVPFGQYSVILDARTSEPVEFHLEICEQHLLYNEGCAIASVMIDAMGDASQRKVVNLDGKRLSGGPWYAPRLAFFAMAVESPGRRVEIDNVSLLGPDGREVLENGDFANGMGRWFFTSERLHLPWHIKNVGLNVLFDQGLLGLLSLTLLVAVALGRLVAGGARRHPAAPYLAAALVGFLVVGAFDSLLDVPRIGFLFYLLTFLGLTLPAAGNNRDRNPA